MNLLFFATAVLCMWLYSQEKGSIHMIVADLLMLAVFVCLTCSLALHISNLATSVIGILVIYLVAMMWYWNFKPTMFPQSETHIDAIVATFLFVFFSSLMSVAKIAMAHSRKKVLLS
jgi:hypothetical protein